MQRARFGSRARGTPGVRGPRNGLGRRRVAIPGRGSSAASIFEVGRREGRERGAPGAARPQRGGGPADTPPELIPHEPRAAATPPREHGGLLGGGPRGATPRGGVEQSPGGAGALKGAEGAGATRRAPGQQVRREGSQGPNPASAGPAGRSRFPIGDWGLAPRSSAPPFPGESFLFPLPPPRGFAFPGWRQGPATERRGVTPLLSPLRLRPKRFGRTADKSTPGLGRRPRNMVSRGGRPPSHPPQVRGPSPHAPFAQPFTAPHTARSPATTGPPGFWAGGGGSPGSPPRGAFWRRPPDQRDRGAANGGSPDAPPPNSGQPDAL